MKTPVKRLDFATISALTFAAPDENRFPCLGLARQALRAGGGFPTLLNAANEVAVRAFLRRTIGFLDIAEIVERVLAAGAPAVPHCVDDVLAIDAAARRSARSAIDAIGRAFVARSLPAGTRMV
jgi:1-deoxy-D-xylulose-5-phosphate reductoisomerase